MNKKLNEKITEALSAVLPITGIVLALSVFVVPLEIGPLALFLVGAVMLILGMGLFQLGAEMSMSPLGEGIGVQLTKSKNVLWIGLISLIMGVIITVAEPDLQVLAEQVPSIPNSVLIFTVAAGVGMFLMLAVLRIIWKVRLSVLLMIMYLVLIIISIFVPADFLAVAFDSGGVTTGPITVPFIMAMGIGIASMRHGRNSADDSFGLIALSSGGPIMAVLVLGCFFNTGEASYVSGEIARVMTMRDVVREFAVQLPHYAWEVFVSILPVCIVFVIFQLTSRRYQLRQIKRIGVGMLYTYLGLVLFLCGVNVGFAPVGSLLGGQLALMEQRWLLVPVGMLIGYFIVKAEPAIQILNHQVQSVTNGAITAKTMNRCLSAGVAISIGIAMVRVLTGISIYWIIIPGYIIALALSLFVPKIFVGIAFDSGGVASGPMTTTFLLPLCIGACQSVGGNIMTDAFGVVALVALTPLIAVQLMGVAYRIKERKLEKNIRQNAITTFDGDDIVELEEDE